MVHLQYLLVYSGTCSDEVFKLYKIIILSNQVLVDVGEYCLGFMQSIKKDSFPVLHKPCIVFS